MSIAVKMSVHGMPSIELRGGPKWIHQLVRNAVTNQWMDSEEYKLGKPAGAFLQGQDDSNPLWTLVEFWGRNHQLFVDFLNREIAKGDPALTTAAI